MAILHAFFAGAQLLLGAIFANAGKLVPVTIGAWALRLEGAAMVAGGAVLLGVAFGMARLRPWTIRIAILYAIATILWASAAIVANIALHVTETFEVPRNLFGLLVVLVVHAVALLYDLTRKGSRDALEE